MPSTLELENAANWIIRDSQFFQVAPKSHLPNYLSLETFNSNVIGVFIDNAEARDTWNFAGWFSQVIHLPFGPNLAQSTINDRRLWLRRKQLLVFPRLASGYKIAIRFPSWFSQVSITIWEYQGVQVDALEAQLIQVQEKLDTLLNKYS